MLLNDKLRKVKYAKFAICTLNITEMWLMPFSCFKPSSAAHLQWYIIRNLMTNAKCLVQLNADNSQFALQSLKLQFNCCPYSHVFGIFVNIHMIIRLFQREQTLHTYSFFLIGQNVAPLREDAVYDISKTNARGSYILQSLW